MEDFKKITFLLFIFSFFGCKSQEIVKEKNNCSNKSQIINFIESRIYDAHKNNHFISSKVLEFTRMKNASFDYLLNTEFTKVKHNSENALEASDIKITGLLNDEEIGYLKCQYQNIRIKNWKEVMSDSLFIMSDSIQKEIKSFKETKNFFDPKYLKISNKMVLYSIPLFSKSMNYAILYQETVASGSLYIYRKKDKNWEIYASSLMWIE